MKLTQEFKEALFAQYWGQKVCCHDGFALQNETMEEVHASTGLYNAYLQLRSIESITDEEAVELATILFPNVKEWQIPDKNNGVLWVDANDYSGNYVAITKEGIEAQTLESTLPYQLQLIVDAFDYLRGRGYAVPFRGVSVEEMVEEGLIKLQNK